MSKSMKLTAHGPNGSRIVRFATHPTIANRWAEEMIKDKDTHSVYIEQKRRPMGCNHDTWFVVKHLTK